MLYHICFIRKLFAFTELMVSGVQLFHFILKRTNIRLQETIVQYIKLMSLRSVTKCTPYGMFSASFLHFLINRLREPDTC